MPSGWTAVSAFASRIGRTVAAACRADGSSIRPGVGGRPDARTPRLLGRGVSYVMCWLRGQDLNL